MSDFLSNRAVWAMLENNRCKRVSLTGLIVDHPEAFASLQEILLREQLFHLLTALVNRREAIDRDLDIFINHENSPILFDRKEKYSLLQCEQICNVAGIHESVIHEYAEVKKA